MAFNVNFDVLVWRLLPVRFRKNIQYGFLKAMVSPLKYVKSLFDTNRGANLYLLAHNGQVCKLEAVLNDTFDPDERRIFITDGPFMDPLYIYRTDEEKPVPLYTRIEAMPIALYTRAETVTMGVQFYVNIPTAVTVMPGYSAIRLKALVNRDRLASKNYYQLIIF